MNVESIREYCLRKAGVSEGFPFGEQTLVFKVMGKLFALMSLETADRMNLKCDPEYALELRDQYPERILPGWHMNKKHWNTVMFGLDLPADLVASLIDHSYDLVVAKLPRKDRQALAEMEQ
ncbi:MAG: MmcQ/YjbR family DNA-binding protein [Bacteroidota bacterium]